MSKIAVLLLQMGGPDSLDTVRPFLNNLFSDRDIIKIGPAFVQPAVARIIAAFRSGKVSEYYRQIGGKSPIRELTGKQASELQKLLGADYRCFVAMRYSAPATAEAVESVLRENIDKVIALPLYPHYSMATTGSSLNELHRCVKDSGAGFSLQCIRHFYDAPLYIEAVAEKIRKGMESFPQGDIPLILFSAHGLPQSFIDAGDPYLEHIQESIRLVMKKFERVSYTLAFQSRAGPVKWLEPSTAEAIRVSAASGKSNILIVPLSFVSDHIETLYEIDIMLRKEAEQAGIANFIRTESLNSSPLFIRSLAELVRGVVF